MGRIRYGAVAAAVAVSGVLGTALAGTEGPHNSAASTSTSIKYSKGAFSGQISVEQPDYPEHLDKYASTKETFYSAVDECLSGRKVTLFKGVKTKKGRRYVEVDATRGDDGGKWSIKRRRASGRFTAAVRPKRVDTLASDPRYGVIVVCSGADTSVLRVQR